MRVRRVLQDTGLLLTMFILGFSLVIPAFNKPSGFPFYDTMVNQGFFPLRDDESGMVEYYNTTGYHYVNYTIPGNSFGVDSFQSKTVNWSYFKQLFNSYVDYSLEYQVNNGSWQNGDEYLTIDKTWDDAGFWKINLTFDNPSHQYINARFTIVVDTVVLDYVNPSGQYAYYLNYSIPGSDEFYSCFFNFSDIAGIPGVVMHHGFVDDVFYFRFRKDDVPFGSHTFDPWFGYNQVAGTHVKFHDSNTCRLIASAFECNGTGYIDNITAYIGYNLEQDIQCAVYEWNGDGDAGDLIGTTQVRTSQTTSNSWNVFNFTDRPYVKNGTKYFLCIKTNENLFGSNSVKGVSSTGDNFYIESGSVISWDSPLTGETDESTQMSIYASYTEIEENTLSSIGLSFTGGNSSEWSSSGLSFSGGNSTSWSSVGFSFGGGNGTSLSWDSSGFSFGGGNVSEYSSTGLSFSGGNVSEYSSTGLSFSGGNSTSWSSSGFSFGGGNGTSLSWDSSGFSFTGGNSSEWSSSGLSFSGGNVSEYSSTDFSFSAGNSSEWSSSGFSFGGGNGTSLSWDSSGFSFGGGNVSEYSSTGLSFSGGNSTSWSSSGFSFGGGNGTSLSWDSSGFSFGGGNVSEYSSTGLSFSGGNVSEYSSTGLSFSGGNSTSWSSSGLSFQAGNSTVLSWSSIGLSFSAGNSTSWSSVGFSFGGGNDTSLTWQDTMFSFTAGNTTQQWQSTGFSFTGGNSSNWISSGLSFSGGNGSIAMNITDPYPGDGSNFFDTQPTLAFTLNHPDDALMNYSIYIGNSSVNTTTLLTTEYNASSGVHTYDNYYRATELGEYYYWRVYAWDDTQHVNETFSFRSLEGGGGMVSTPGFEVFSFVGGLFLLCLFLFFKRKKRKAVLPKNNLLPKFE